MGIFVIWLALSIRWLCTEPWSRAPALNQAFQGMRGTPTSLRWYPARWRYMERQQCSNRPAMVGDPSRHGRCPGDRCRARRLGSKAETRVIRAKVIDRANQVHPVLQRQRVTCERPTAAGQGCQALPKRGVEPVTVGRRIAPPTAAPERRV
jgi:hypothetical protein